MVLKTIAVGKSTQGDAYEAGQQAARKAISILTKENLAPHFALIFATTGYDQTQLLTGITGVIGDIPSAGCTGEGIISQEGGDESSCAVTIMLFADKKLNFTSFIQEGLKNNSTSCAKKIAESVNKIASKNDHGMLFIFPDGITSNTTKIVNELNKGIDKSIPILGGTAGDMLKFEKTYQYHNGKVCTDALVAVYITGQFIVDWTVTHGCEAIGLEKIVTKSNENILMELDNQPTWDVFKEYLPGNPNTLQAEDAFHLCLGELYKTENPPSENMLIRMPVSLNQETGAVKFPAEIPVGTHTYLARRDPGTIAENIKQSTKALLERHKDKQPIAVFQFDCAGRGCVIFGSHVNDEVNKPLQQLFPGDTPWIGFYTYGEFAPLFEKTLFHNFTAVLVILFDDHGNKII